ncbi:MAG: porin [Xanthobacteraceae bacterium]|jgi:predicted porin
MSKFSVSAAMILGLAGAACATAALADDPMVTKAPMVAVAPAPPVACSSFWDFIATSCPLTWYGVTFYGTVDVGGGYQTHGTPFDPNFPTGASYLIAKPSRLAEWGLAPNAMSQSVVGVKVDEPIAPGWHFISQNELAFDPYSGLLANAPQAMQNSIGVPLNQQLYPVDSSRWGWLAGQNYAGFSSPTYGTLTFGRQNALETDGVIAYDPMGGSYAFSPIGFSGTTCGAGDTELCRWTTALKYRENIGPVRLAVMGQFGNYADYNPSNGAIAGQLGGDIKNLGPGTLSLDAIATFAKDAVNIGPTGGTPPQNGVLPITFPAQYLAATISNQTGVMALAKYSFGSWSQAPVVGKAPPSASGVPLTLYAGYEWIQFAPPSDPQTSFRDDGFLFTAFGGNPNLTTANAANPTGINNVAYTSLCGTGTAGVGCSDKILQVFWIGAKYAVTNNLDVIGAYYHYDQNNFTSGAATCANPYAHSQCAGTFDAYSAVIDWRFAPKWDTYIGFMFSQNNGGLDNGYISRNNIDPTAGLRFRF